MNKDNEKYELLNESSFPIPSIDDKVIVFDKFDINFETPLVIIDGVSDVSIKEELNGAFELNMKAVHKDNKSFLSVGNYVQVAGDMFKINEIDQSRDLKSVNISLQCEHVYFELLDDYIHEAGTKTFYPHELASYISEFTNFEIKVDPAVINNKQDFPKRRVTISRGSPIKTINRMLELWNLDMSRFRRVITITDGLNKDKLQLFKHQKNISSLKRVDRGGKITTRLHLIGNQGLSLIGMDVNDIPFNNKTKDGITTILTDEDVVLCTVESKEGKITSKYIDSKFINNYAIPRNGEIVEGSIDDKVELLEEGVKKLIEIDAITNSYTISAIELKSYYGDIERFGLGYTAIIQDEDLLSDNEYNRVESRIIEYEYNPFDPNDDSTIKLGYKNERSLDFFKSVDETKEIVEESAWQWEDTSDKIDKVIEGGLHLSWDTNKDALIIDDNETEVADVILEMGDNSDAQGQLLMNIISDSAATFIVRVYDGDTQELFSPIIREVNRGNNTIGIPHGYYMKREGVHRLSITAQSIDGTAYIQSKGVSYNVKASGGRASAVSIEASDISIRNYGIEDEVYLIGLNIEPEKDEFDFDTDEEKLTKRYPVVQKTKYIENNIYSNSDITPVWEMKDLLGMKNLMLEFNGLFRLPFGEEQYKLFTQNKPWIFWITPEKELWGQYGDEVNTGLMLADSVNQASVVKGWSMIGYEGDNDMGLVLAYVKIDGSINYRQLKGLKSINGTNNGVWNQERIIAEAGTGNTAVHVNRLNDYRIAFSVEGVNKIFISERFYVGQASPVEYVNLNAGLDDRSTFITVYPKDDIPYELMPTWSTNDNKVFTLTANYYWEKRGEDCFANVDNQSRVEISSVEINPLNKHELIITMAEKITAGSLKVTPNHRDLIGVHPNGTRIKLDQEILVFEVRQKISETVNLNIGLEEANIDIYQLADIEVYTPVEVVELNLYLETDLEIYRHSNVYISNEGEVVELNIGVTASLEISQSGSIIT